MSDSIGPCNGRLISADCELFSNSSRPVRGAFSDDRGRPGVGMETCSFLSSTIPEGVSVHDPCVKVALC